MIRDIVCIKCPLGCAMRVVKNGSNIDVSGNNCNRGKLYAIEELTNPKRIVTSLIKTSKKLYSVKTTDGVEKSKIFDVLREIEKLKVPKNATIGTILTNDILNQNCGVVITGVRDI